MGGRVWNYVSCCALKGDIIQRFSKLDFICHAKEQNKHMSCHYGTCVTPSSSFHAAVCVISSARPFGYLTKSPILA
jgi:hypothetical protein